MGPLVQKMSEKVPAGKIDEGAAVEERDVEVEVFVLEQMVGFDGIVVRPDIQPGDPDEDGNEQCGQPGKGAGGGFGDAPDDDAPGTAGQVLQHDQRQTAESQPEIEQVGKKI